MKNITISLYVFPIISSPFLRKIIPALLLFFSFLSLGISQSIILSSQEDVNKHDPSIKSISGSLILNHSSGDPISNIINLGNLESVGGDISIEKTLLIDLGPLSKLTHIGGKIRLYENLELTDINAFSNIESIGGGLVIISNPALVNIEEGLANLKSIGENISISNNTALTNTKDIKNLTSVGTNIFINGNDALTEIDFLSQVTAIPGNVRISFNDALTNINGLQKVKEIGENLDLEYNTALTNVDGLSQLERIEGTLYFRINKIENLDGLKKLTYVGESVNISGNNYLTNLDGLENLTSIGEDINIRSNSSLTNCCGIQELLNTPGAIKGFISISSNPSECSSAEEIKNSSCKPCWSTGLLEFCATSGKWEAVSGQQNKISATDVLSINDFLFFDGTMTIDTVELQVTAQGEFYVENIPTPGGEVGKYALSKGSYDLKLLGADGTITNFLNASISERAKIFNIEFNLDKLQLVKTNNDIGLKIVCTIKVPGISGGCDDGSGKNTEIKLDGLGITTGGITLDGVNVKDLGMFVPKFCLKQLNLSYDSQKDILTAGAGVAMPFGEVAGGLKLEEGLIDSIGWLLEASTPPFVLGTTTIGIKGFYGHISNITKPAIEVELGGIFSDILSDDLYRITASGKTIWPTYFEIAGTGQFMRPILNTLPFQLQGGLSLGYNIPNSLLNVKVNGKFGTIDEQKWLMSGDGLLRVNHRTANTTFNGYFNGMMNVNTDVFVKDPPMPIPYVTSIIGLPFSAETKNTLHYGKRKNFFGSITLEHYILGKYKLNYLIDLTLPMDDPDYFFWQANRESAKASTTREEGEQITVPENTEYTIIHIISESSPPPSTLSSPSGDSFTTSSEEDRILYSEGINGKEAFWTMLAPEPGTWMIALDNPTETNEIFYYHGATAKAFAFTVDQNGNTVNVTWDPSGMESGETVTVMLNDNNEDFNGFQVAEADATAGSVSFELNNSTPDCRYYLYTELIETMNIQQTYSDVLIWNTETALAPPQNFKAEYISEDEGFDLTWQIDPEDDISGWIITTTDEAGRDSIYAVLHPYESEVTLLIDNYENHSIRIEAFDEEGKVGCPAEIDQLSQTCAVSGSDITATICPGETYQVGQSSYSASGIYTDILATAEGCDSTVHLDLTVIDLDNHISVVDDEIIADETAASSYQWMDCSTGEDISGANDYVFDPLQSGNYAVRMVKEGCEVISECISFTTGIDDLTAADISIYPNPANQEIRIFNPGNMMIGPDAWFYDIIGRSYQLRINEGTINISELAPGMYILILNVNDKSYKTIAVIMK